MSPILILGYGNPSRGDDALGPEFLRRLEEAREAGRVQAPFETITDFQLQIEHALDLQGRELVLFVDASVSAAPPFQFARLLPEQDDSYTTHAMSPASVLSVYERVCTEPAPPCYLLTIRGDAFELGEPISPQAMHSLELALTTISDLLNGDPLNDAADLAAGAPGGHNGYLAEHVELLLASYRRWTGEELIDPAATPAERARALWQAPFVVLSHGLEEDPIFNYGNRTALRLFEYGWEAFTALPSRYSAEPANREERARVLEEVRRQGYSRGYRGVRISRDGRRFRIDRAVVWNLVDGAGAFRGQAATFPDWEEL